MTDDELARMMVRHERVTWTLCVLLGIAACAFGAIAYGLPDGGLSCFFGLLTILTLVIDSAVLMSRSGP